jgi:HD-like signal output (HDOD) protein/CheY-like chemotaxis protein
LVEAPTSTKAVETVLVVESEDLVRRAIEGALGQQGYKVTVSASATEARETAATEAPEAILFADKPPGGEVMTFLRGAPDADVSPVIVTGPPPAMARVVDILRAGAIDYLRKPMTPKAIVDAVARAAGIAKQRRQQREGSGAAADVPLLGVPPAVAHRGPRPLHPALGSILDAIKRQEIEIPAVPTVVSELRRALSDQRASLDDLSRLIQRDQSLSLDVLKVANSAIYARGSRTSDLKMAVGRIGLKQLEGLIETVFLRGCFQPRQPTFKSLLSEIWRYSVAMAIAMRILAENLTGPSRLDPGVAYVTGLFSDVGAAFLLWLVSERAPDLEMEIFVPFVRERHETVGGQLLATMGLDPAIAQLASYHHTQSPPTGVSLYWSLAAVASELADRAVPRGDLTRTTLRGASFVGQSADALRISEVALRKATDQLDLELAGILEALS